MNSYGIIILLEEEFRSYKFQAPWFIDKNGGPQMLVICEGLMLIGGRDNSVNHSATYSDLIICMCAHLLSFLFILSKRNNSHIIPYFFSHSITLNFS